MAVVIVVVAMSRIQTRKQRQTLKPNGKAQLFPTTFCNYGKKKNAEQHIDISECRTCGFSNDGIIT